MGNPQAGFPRRTLARPAALPTRRFAAHVRGLIGFAVLVADVTVSDRFRAFFRIVTGRAAHGEPNFAPRRSYEATNETLLPDVRRRPVPRRWSRRRDDRLDQRQRLSRLAGRADRASRRTDGRRH